MFLEFSGNLSMLYISYDSKKDQSKILKNDRIYNFCTGKNIFLISQHLNNPVKN